MSPTIVEPRPNSIRLPPLRYFVLTLVALIAGLIAWPLTIEVRRHQALEQFLDDSVGIDLVIRPTIPDAIAARLPKDWTETWFVDVSEISIDLTDRTAGVDTMALLTRFPEARQITVTTIDVNSALLQRLSRFEQVENLEIYAENIQGGWEFVEKLKRMKTLLVNTQTISSEGLARLRQLQSLEEMNLAADELTSLQFDEISHIPRLAKLNLYIEGTFGGDLSHLASLSQLRELDLLLQAPEFLQGVSKLTHLETLNVSIEDLTDEHLPELLPLKNLESLSIETHARLGAVLARLEELPKLQKLTLSAPTIADGGIEALTRFRLLRLMSLDSPSLNSSGVDDAGNPIGLSPLVKALLKRPDVDVLEAPIMSVY